MATHSSPMSCPRSTLRCCSGPDFTCVNRGFPRWFRYESSANRFDSAERRTANRERRTLIPGLLTEFHHLIQSRKSRFSGEMHHYPNTRFSEGISAKLERDALLLGVI